MENWFNSFPTAARNARLNPNSEAEPRNGAKNTQEPSRGWIEEGKFQPGPFSYQKLGFALFVPFRGKSISEFGLNPVANE